MDIFVVLNIVYRALLVYIGTFVVWNMIKDENPREQVMAALVIIPMFLRVVGIK